MDAERWWPPFVEVVALVWIALFAVDVAISFGLLYTICTSGTAPCRSGNS